MDKKGMRRYGPNEEKQHMEQNDVPPVPELQGKAKHTKEKANPIKYDGKPNTTFDDEDEGGWL